MTSLDFLYAIATGLITGIIAWRIFRFLDKPKIFGVPAGAFVFIVPIVWIIGIWLGVFLGQWIPFFSQFGKFAAIGFTNAAVDFAALNFLIYLSGKTKGIAFTVFKAFSFVVATMHSFFWNKYWVFEAGASAGGGTEFAQFFGVAISAMIVNVAIASIVVNLIGPRFGTSEKAWATIGAAFGSATGLIFSFLGFSVVFN